MTTDRFSYLRHRGLLKENLPIRSESSSKDYISRQPYQMEYVLCHPDGRAIKCFRRLIGRALKQHKIFGVTPHGLRKTFCSLLARQKVHPKVAQELIGHSEIGLTMKVYTEVDDGQLAEAVNSLPTMQDWIKPQLKVVGGGRE